MLVRPRRRFPGTAFMVRGSAVAHIWPHLLVIVTVAAILTANFERWGLDRWSLTTIPFTLVGLALSIFLGFRNNACYDRWWEARKLWGRLINTTRTLSRQTLTLVNGEGPEVEAFQKELIYRTMAYAHALRLHLRRQDRPGELAPFLAPEELARLERERNKPIALLHLMGERYTEAWKREWVHTMHVPVFEATLTELTDIQGGCERIKNTPVPLSYTILTHRIVAVYCFALPFGIVADVGSLTPVVVLIVAFAFLGLDSVGSQIEDPFEEDVNDLPLLALSRTIEKDLRERLGETDLPPDVQPVRGVLL